jgi:hypothetical protein
MQRLSVMACWTSCEAATVADGVKKSCEAAVVGEGVKLSCAAVAVGEGVLGEVSSSDRWRRRVGRAAKKRLLLMACWAS